MDIPFKTPAVALAALLFAAGGFSSAVMASEGAARQQPGQVHAPGDVQTAQNESRGDRRSGREGDQSRKKNVPATPAAKPDGARDGGRRQDRVQQDRRRETPRAAPRRERPEAKVQRPSRQRDVVRDRTSRQREVVRDRRTQDRPVVRTVDRPRQERATRNREQVRRNTVIQERRARYKTYHRNYDAPRRYRVDQYRWDRGHSYRRYGYGQQLPSYYFARSFWITSFGLYGLFAPPYGLIWVRYGPDALLIDQETGEIVQVRYNMFYS
jgi:hypothetical protein